MVICDVHVVMSLEAQVWLCDVHVVMSLEAQV